MSKTKLFTRISTIILALATTAAVTASCGSSQSPMETIDAAADVSYTAVNEKSEFSKKLQDVGSKGSIELKADIGKLLELSYAASNLDLSASLKAYADADNKRSAISADLTSGGASVVDALLYVANDSVSVSSDALFGENAYGFSTVNFVDSFVNSEFGENGDFSLDISAEDIEGVVEALKLYSEMQADVEARNEKLTAAWDRLKAELYPIIENSGKASVKASQFEVAGNSIKTTAVNFTYDADQVIDLVKSTVTLLKTHEAADEMLGILLETGMDYMGDAALYEMGLYGYTTDELKAAITEGYDEILNEIDSIKDDIEGFEFSLTVHISKSTKEIIGATLDITEGENYAVVEIVCGPSILDLDEIGISFEVYTADYGTTETLSVTYEVAEDTKDTYKAYLNYEENSAVEEIALVEWNKQTGNYEITVSADGEVYGIEGVFLNEKDLISFSVNSVTSGAYSIDLGEIALVMKANDTMPTNGDYIDLFSMNELEIYNVVSDISESAQAIAGLLGIE